jgi:hypothetical protein
VSASGSVDIRRNWKLFVAIEFGAQNFMNVLPNFIDGVVSVSS